MMHCDIIITSYYSFPCNRIFLFSVPHVMYISVGIERKFLRMGSCISEGFRITCMIWCYIWCLGICVYMYFLSSLEVDGWVLNLGAM